MSFDQHEFVANDTTVYRVLSLQDNQGFVALAPIDRFGYPLIAKTIVVNESDLHKATPEEIQLEK